MQLGLRPIIASVAALLIAAPLLAAKKPSTRKFEGVPAAPAGFNIGVFAKAPDIYSPASMCVSPDGKVFVGIDEYNTGPDRAMGTSRVRQCVDTDNDGVADKFTDFADKVNAPQGMTYVGGILYVVHAPLLTAFRDIDGDGIADTRKDLITGLGPEPEGLVHHIPSGLRMGIDGWLYISVGDKGIVKATGADGRTVSIHGGAVVRVRPDGTEMELFSSHTRNTFDVSVDPLLDTFTRDNTNDGGGWASRLTQMQRGGEFGYPSLFLNYGDEIIQPLADYGGGSATGSMYIHEPGMPGKTGDSLYTNDWAKGTLFRHELVRNGASFTVNAEEFVKCQTPSDVDCDGESRIYLADWDRRGWGASSPLGVIYMLEPKDYEAPPFPNMTAAIKADLLKHLTSRSAVRRLAAQREILRRGADAATIGELNRIITSPGELYARVAAMFTYVQLQGPAAAPTLAVYWRDPQLREFALKALADRDSMARIANPNLFAASLDDRDARVRLQAAIGIGYLNRGHLAPMLIPLTTDNDRLVRHAAMQSLRRLKAIDACAAALASESSPQILAGVLRTMRMLPDARSVAAIGTFLDHQDDPILRQEVARALGRLYEVEAPWDGKWWTPRPETHGPNYQSAQWEQSPQVAKLLVPLIDDSDLETARTAMSQAGWTAMKEAIDALARRITTPNPLRAEAANALIQMKSTAPTALAAEQAIAQSDAFTPETRSAAAAALGAADGPEAQAALAQLVEKLQATLNLPPGLLDRACDALGAKPAVAANVPALAALLAAPHQSVRAAAATALLRSSENAAVDRISKSWTSLDAGELEAVLIAMSRLPVDSVKTYRDRALTLSRDKREAVRHAAISALGHIGDASAVKDLVALAASESDRPAAASALAEIGPDHTPDDQVQVVAKLLVETSAGVSRKGDQAAYGKILAAAQKFLDDKRMPAAEKTSLLAKMKQPGVISSYLRTDAIPAPSEKESFSIVFPPEQHPAGPFEPFSVNGNAVTWKPLEVNDPHGVQKLDLPVNSVAYFTTTIDSPAASGALFSCGSDDGMQAWLNGARIYGVDDSRATKADLDKTPVTLRPGKNVLLIKINNHGDGSGIQARMRMRVAEFAGDELIDVVQNFPGDVTRGRALFDSAGCVKCHTLDPHEDPKGPYLGGAGSKYDGRYLAESVLRPAAKVAQGFGTEKVVAKDDTGGTTEYIGFLARDAADSIQLRDLTGRVSVIPKARIVKRLTLAGTMMPDGLADAMSLDDFASLIKFLQSMKEKP